MWFAPPGCRPQKAPAPRRQTSSEQTPTPGLGCKPHIAVVKIRPWLCGNAVHLAEALDLTLGPLWFLSTELKS